MLEELNKANMENISSQNGEHNEEKGKLCHKLSYQIRKLRSKGAIIILVWLSSSSVGRELQQNQLHYNFICGCPGNRHRIRRIPSKYYPVWTRPAPRCFNNRDYCFYTLV